METRFDVGEEALIAGTIFRIERVQCGINPKTLYYFKEYKDMPVPEDALVPYTGQEDKYERLYEVCRDAVEFLQKNFHPETSIIINADNIRVVETAAAKPIEYAPD